MTNNPVKVVIIKTYPEDEAAGLQVGMVVETRMENHNGQIVYIANILGHRHTLLREQIKGFDQHKL